MSDVNTSGEATRAAIAKREWINDSGEKVVAGDPSAVGFRYTYLATGKSVDYIIGEAGKLATMFGIMGGLTKVGNIVNSIVNADDYDGAADPMTEVSDWLAKADAGEWREPGEGGVARGPKYDLDVLSTVWVAILGSLAKGNAAHYRARLEDTKGERDVANKGYRLKVIARDDVKAAYWAEMTKRGVAKPATDATALA